MLSILRLRSILRLSYSVYSVCGVYCVTEYTRVNPNCFPSSNQTKQVTTQLKSAVFLLIHPSTAYLWSCIFSVESNDKSLPKFLESIAISMNQHRPSSIVFLIHVINSRKVKIERLGKSC